MRFRIVWQKDKDAKKRKVTLLGSSVLIFFGSLIAVVFAELFLRYLFALPLEKDYLRFSCYNYKKIPRENHDQDLFWNPTEEFRKVKYSLKKDNNTFRIICIGDSITQGYKGKDLLPREQTYVYKLEQMLTENFKGRKIEVINAGSGGYSSFQGAKVS